MLFIHYQNSYLQAVAVMEAVGLPQLLALFGQPAEDICTATSNLFQSLINGITDLHRFREEKAKHESHTERTGSHHGSKFRPLKLGKDCRLSSIVIYYLYYLL